MITAQEAREKIDTLSTKHGEEEKSKAEEQITAAMERGEYECRLDFSPSNALTTWLTSLGYHVRPIISRRANPCENGGDSSPHTLVEW